VADFVEELSENLADSLVVVDHQNAHRATLFPAIAIPVDEGLEIGVT
jgi:hypothetical protein